MFKNLGMDNGKAAQFSSMLILAYTAKPLFAPFLEMYRTKKFFVICAQVIIGLGFVGVSLAMSLPGYMTLLMPLFWLLSFAGATQDIACDGVYITTLDLRTQSLYCGLQSLSWDIGPVVASGGLVYLSGIFHTHFFNHDSAVSGSDWINAWQMTFLIAACIVILSAAWHSRKMPAGVSVDNTPATVREASHILFDTFSTFFRKRGIWRMIAFIFLFRLSVGFLEKIGSFFMVDASAKGGLGLSNELLGIIYGTFGLGAMLLGSLLGGLFVAKRGLKASLFYLCCAMNIPNVTFLIMSISLPKNLIMISAGVIIEKFFFGFGGVGSMIYMMQQLARGRYSTAHYAFGTGLMALSWMCTGIISGYLQQRLGYIDYFVFVMVATIPSFLSCWLAPFHNKEDAEPTTDYVAYQAVGQKI